MIVTAGRGVNFQPVERGQFSTGVDNMEREARQQEFAAYYEAEARRLYNLAWLLTFEKEQAADLAQETMLRIYERWHRIRNDDPRPYARRTLVNLYRSMCRRRVLDRKRSPTTAPKSVDGPEERVSASVDLAWALRMLSPIRRAVLVLRFYEDMTEPEIARALDRPLGTIKSDVRRSLKQLKDHANFFLAEGDADEPCKNP